MVIEVIGILINITREVDNLSQGIRNGNRVDVLKCSVQVFQCHCFKQVDCLIVGEMVDFGMCKKRLGIFVEGCCSRTRSDLKDLMSVLVMFGDVEPQDDDLPLADIVSLKISVGLGYW